MEEQLRHCAESVSIQQFLAIRACWCQSVLPIWILRAPMRMRRQLGDMLPVPETMRAGSHVELHSRQLSRLALAV